MTIYDLITAADIQVYYNENNGNAPQYMGETLWQPSKQTDLVLTQIKGAKGKPVVLKASAYDVQAIPRARAKADMLITEIPYFKESMVTSEKDRKALNHVIATGNQDLINLELNRIYNDPLTLIEAARARREQMRMMLLASGTIAVDSNGQVYTYDYGVPDSHKITAATAWSDPAADIIGDINKGLEVLATDASQTPTRGVVNRLTWLNVKKNAAIAKIAYPLSTTPPTAIRDEQVREIIEEFCGIKLAVNNDTYVGDDGAAHKFFPDNTASFFPAGYLGRQVFATTPQEDDLLVGAAANVSIVDLGVSITTAKKIDPVNVETIVAMCTLPDFPVADDLLVIDTGSN